MGYMEITLREQLSIPESSDSNGFGLVLIGKLFERQSVSPTWVTSDTFTLPHPAHDVNNIILKAYIWRVQDIFANINTIPGSKTIFLNQYYSGRRDVPLTVMSAGFAIPVGRVLYNANGIYRLDLESPIPPHTPSGVLTLVNYERVELTPALQNDVFSVKWPPYHPEIFPVATVTYKTPVRDMPTVRLSAGHNYSNPVLDRLDSPVLFINTNAEAETSRILYNSLPYDYYYVPLDGSLDLAPLTNEFHQIFECPVKEEFFKPETVAIF